MATQTKPKVDSAKLKRVEEVFHVRFPHHAQRTYRR
jgi:hypothetical protein